MKIFSILILTTSLILSQTGIEIARMVDTRKTPKDMFTQAHWHAPVQAPTPKPWCSVISL